MKFVKWILGVIAGIIGVITLLVTKRNTKKVKKIKKDVKVSEKKVTDIKIDNTAIKETQQNYKKAVEDMKQKKETRTPPKVSGDEANKYIKDFLKKRKTK
jgi:hypothetical protein